jgi:hypothetical protein
VLGRSAGPSGLSAAFAGPAALQMGVAVIPSPKPSRCHAKPCKDACHTLCLDGGQAVPQVAQLCTSGGSFLRTSIL